MGHSFENYGARAWTVAFLMFAMGLQGMHGLPLGLSAPTLMAAIVLAGSFGGYFGGTLGERYGRRRVAIIVVAASLIAAVAAGLSPVRSEEQTSELQSLMRISYAVFCFKKKN